MGKFRKGEELKLVQEPWGFLGLLSNVKKVIYIRYVGGWGNNRYKIEIEMKDGTKQTCTALNRHITTLYTIGTEMKMLAEGTNILKKISKPRKKKVVVPVAEGMQEMHAA
jgi:hypothetical protein